MLFIFFQICPSNTELQKTFFKSECSKYIATPQNVYLIMSRTDEAYIGGY